MQPGIPQQPAPLFFIPAPRPGVQQMQPVPVVGRLAPVQLGLPANLPPNAYYDRNQYLPIVQMYLPGIKELPEGLYTDWQAREWAQRERSKRQQHEEFINKKVSINKNQGINSNGLYEMLLNKELTDVTIKLPEGVEFKAHKVILGAASDYFKAQFGRFRRGDVLAVTETSAKVFQQYLAFVYGQEIDIKDWRDAFDLFDYINFTKTNWDDKGTTAVYSVRFPVKDFVEYIGRLAELYDGEIPNAVLESTADHLLELVDLSPLGEEAMIVLLNSEYLFTGPSKPEFIAYMRKLGVDAALLDRVEANNEAVEW